MKQENPIDKILGEQLPVLDKGFVRVIDYLGDDSAIVQAARVSYGKGTKKKSEDEELIRYLIRHRHTSPFEMCEIKLHVRVPMDCWRQWIRHRTANVNEYSTRYSVAIDAMAATKPDEWRLQDKSINRQGSMGSLDIENGGRLSELEKEIQEHSRKIYEERLELGVAREQARKDLPLSTYTEAYWKIDLHNLLNFLRLRMDPKAQYEIREYANVIGHQIVKRWVPVTWQAFLDYSLHSIALSQIDKGFIKLLANGQTSEALAGMKKIGWVKIKGDKAVPNLEAREFANKLEELGIDVPW